MKLVLFIVMTLSAVNCFAADTWTDWRDVGDIYTYAEEDTLYVYLEGLECPNTKKYFSILPNQVNNAKQLISMVLAAKMAKAKINILYDPAASPTYCYFKGLKI